MKYILSLIVALFFSPEVYAQNRDIIAEVEKIINNNVCFYVGGIGMINKDLFIKKDASDNIIYSKTSGEVFNEQPCHADDVQIVKIKKEGKRTCCEHVDRIDYHSNALFVVFSSKAIYIIDLAFKQFGKYLR